MSEIEIENHVNVTSVSFQPQFCQHMAFKACIHWVFDILRWKTLKFCSRVLCSKWRPSFDLCSDGRAVAVGGMGADLLPRSVLQQYDLRKDVWALLPPMPTPRYDTSVCLLGSKIYVAGLLSRESLCICYLPLYNKYYVCAYLCSWPHCSCWKMAT